MTLSMPRSRATAAIGAEVCGRVKEVRTIKGDCAVIAEVAALKMTSGTLASSRRGAMARASGVK